MKTIIPPKTVLIIDDDTNLLTTLRDILTLEPTITVHTATNAREAIEFLDQVPVALVICDIRMPEMDGIAFIDRVNKMMPGLRCIMMTAYTSDTYWESSLIKGAVGYLEKPFDLDDFLAVVKENITPTGFKAHDVSVFNLVEILQLIGLSQKTIALKVKSAKNGYGFIFFRNGEPIHAKTEKAVGTKAFYEILDWKEGDFTFFRISPSLENTIQDSLMHLILESMRLKDERNRQQVAEFNMPLSDGVIDFDELEHMEKQMLKDTNMEKLQETQDYLKKELDGFVTCVIIDVKQGTILAGAAADPKFDLATSSAHFLNTYNSVIKVFDVSGWGKPSEILVPGESHVMFLMPIKSGLYFQSITTTSQNSIGMVRAVYNMIKMKIEQILK